MGHSILWDICDHHFFFPKLWGLFAAQAKQLHRAEEIPKPSARWVLPTPALVVVLLMQHKLGGLIISTEVNYISHYSKSPVHAMLSTSFNSLPPVTEDFCSELLLCAPWPFQAPSSVLALPCSCSSSSQCSCWQCQSALVGHAVPQVKGWVEQCCAQLSPGDRLGAPQCVCPVLELSRW